MQEVFKRWEEDLFTELLNDDGSRVAYQTVEQTPHDFQNNEAIQSAATDFSELLKAAGTIKGSSTSYFQKTGLVKTYRRNGASVHKIGDNSDC